MVWSLIVSFALGPLSSLLSMLLQTSSQLKWMQRSHICVLFKGVCCAVCPGPAGRPIWANELCWSDLTAALSHSQTGLWSFKCRHEPSGTQWMSAASQTRYMLQIPSTVFGSNSATIISLLGSLVEHRLVLTYWSQSTILKVLNISPREELNNWTIKFRKTDICKSVYCFRTFI